MKQISIYFKIISQNMSDANIDLNYIFYINAI